MGIDVDDLAAFVPPSLLRYYGNNPQPLEEARWTPYQAIVLFLDLSGFSRLADRLSHESKDAAAERLSEILNDHIGAFVGAVGLHGGEVVAFAGDALVAMWPETIQEDKCLEALACALSIVDLSTLAQKQSGVEIPCTMGLGCGDVVDGQVGGLEAEWYYFVQGPALLAAIEAEGKGESASINLASGMMQRLGPRVQCQKIEGHSVWVLRRIAVELPRAGPLEISVVPEMLQALSGCVPAFVQERLAIGHGDWLSEIRPVTVLFIHLVGEVEESEKGRVQSLVQGWQQSIFDFGGTIDKIVVDDKGLCLLAVFGLPPHSYEDDAQRAVEAALQAQMHFRDQGWDVQLGIASGDVYCGVVGNPKRHEYTVIGDAVNLAARLMACDDAPILCDKSTAGRLRDPVQVEFVAKVALKGKAEDEMIFRPSSYVYCHGQEQGEGLAEGSFCGREAELAMLHDALDDMAGDRAGRIFVIEGPPGMGKSVLVRTLLEAGRRKDHVVAYAATSSLQSSPLHLVWRQLIWTILCPNRETQVGFESSVVKALKNLKELDFLPLLGPVLDIAAEENVTTLAMSPEMRHDKMQELLKRLIESKVGQDGFVLAIDDVQWLSPLSWKIIYSLYHNLQPLLILTLRPTEARARSNFLQCFITEGTHLLLYPLAFDDTRELIARVIGVKRVPDVVAKLVYKTSKGNPFFAREIVLNLRDSGVVVTEGGVCELVSKVADDVPFVIPTTLSDVLRVKIDSLKARTALVLKVASLIGDQVNVRILRGVFPLEQDAPQVKRHLEDLTEGGFLSFHSAALEGTYQFLHVTIREAASRRLLQDQKKQIHERCASWYRKADKENRDRYAAEIAHHLLGAGHYQDALASLESAIDAAAEAAMYDEVIRFLKRALDAAEQISKDKQGKVHRFQRMRWQRLLAEAHFGMGDLKQSMHHAAQTLTLGLRPIPIGRLAWGLALVAERLKYVGLSRIGRYMGIRDKDREGAFIQGSLAANRFAICALESNHLLEARVTSLLAVNQATRVIRTSHIAEVYLTAAETAALSGANNRAEHFLRLAGRIAKKTKNVLAQIQLAQVQAEIAMAQCDWPKAERSIALAMGFVAEHGNRQVRDGVLRTRSDFYYFRGKLLESMDDARRALDLARNRGNTQFELWAILNQVRALIAMGGVPEAWTLLEKCQGLAETSNDFGARFLIEAFMAWTALKLGKKRSAARFVRQAVQRIAKRPPTTFHSVEGYRAICEVCVALHTSLGAANRKHKEILWALFLKTLERYESTVERYPLGEADWWFCKATRLLVEHQGRAARRAVEKSLALARRHYLPLAEARALRLAGTLVSYSNRRRARMLDLAHRIFKENYCHACSLETQRELDAHLRDTGVEMELRLPKG